MQELLRNSAMEQFSAIKNKKVSAVELTKASLERIHSIDEKLGAFNSLTEETALETAKKVDEKIATGEVELVADTLTVLGKSQNMLPFDVRASRQSKDA